jgi:hypothetical protein
MGGPTMRSADRLDRGDFPKNEYSAPCFSDSHLILQRDLLSDQYVRYEYQNIAKTGNQSVTRLIC